MKKLLFLLCFFLFSLHACAELHFSEIMADNGEFLSGEQYDWIEIYNSGPEDMDLSGFGLSDSAGDPWRFQFPEGAILPAGNYAIVYCTGNEKPLPSLSENQFASPFGLAKEGESLLLSDLRGKRIASLRFPRQYGGVSYGFSQETGEWGFFESPTPGKANAEKMYFTRAERPFIHQEPGFYSLQEGECLEIALSASGPIRYTLDGSEPSRESSLYTGPISITETTVIRARTCDEKALLSPCIAATFLINDPSPVPILSLSTDEKYLYNDALGLFVKGSGETPNYLSDWEYPLHVEYFDEAGIRRLSQMGSFRLTGDSSRAFPQKSLAIFARSAYGDEEQFHYAFFNNRDYEAYRSFVLRSAASDYRFTRMKDAVMTEMAAGLDIMYQAARPVIVYINGDYAGHFNLREKINKHSVAQWEGVADSKIIDRIDLIENGHAQNGSAEDFSTLQNFVLAHDLNIPENLKYVQDRLDIENFFIWASMEMCLLNKDLENVRIYRIPDGKWKYILYDVEGGGVSDLHAVYMLLSPDRTPFPASSQHELLKKLLDVPEMRDLFLKTFAHVLKNSFLFDQTAASLLDQWEETLSPLLPRHMERWQLPLTMEKWRANMEETRNALRESPCLALNTLCDLLSLTEEERAHYFAEAEALLEMHNAPPPNQEDVFGR